MKTSIFQIQNKCLFPESLGYVNWKWRILGKEVSLEGRIMFSNRKLLWLE